MDFAEAVAQHQAWQQRLRRILFGRERRRRPGRTEAIEACQCPLDQWLQENAALYGLDPWFGTVGERHRLCHEHAIQMVLEDEETKASLDLVLQTGRFRILSSSLLEALEQLRRNHALSAAPLRGLPQDFPREEPPPFPDVPG